MHYQHTVFVGTRFRLSVLAVAVTSCCAALAAEPATTAPHADEGDVVRIEVIGQAASLEQSLRDQRASDRIESVVKADGIGQLPDDNAAEALQRVPGISIERDQGEGRFIRVRGLSPDLNAVTINGSLVPAPESERRAVALDVLPAELVQSVSVVKTLTPDMDANSLGGTVEVESLSAFDYKGGFYSLSAESSYDDNTGEYSPKYAAAFSSRLGNDERFGIAAATNFHDRTFGSDNVETGGDWDFDDAARLASVEQRDYSIERERIGAALNFDYRPDDDSRYWLRTLYSRFADQEYRQLLKAEFANALLDGQSGTAEVERELKDREETQTIYSLVLGVDKQFETWRVEGQLGYGRAGEDNPDQLDPAVFTADGGEAGFSNTRRPQLQLAEAFYLADSFSLDEAEIAESDTTDSEHNARLDFSRSFNWGDADATLKFGAKLSRREKDNDVEVWAYEDFGDYGISDAALSLTALCQGSVDYALGGFGPAISSAAVRQLLGQLDRDEFHDDEASRIEDFTMQEDIDAAYVMQTVDWDNWRLIAGVRFEKTQFAAEGTGLRDGEFETVTAKRDDEHWLPGLHGRYLFGDNTQIRLALTHSVVRPTFGERAPGFVIDGDEAEFGNPNLKPLESRNLDAGIEHFFGKASVLSAFVFHKDIDNFVYQTDLAGSGDWAEFDEAISFANGDSASVYGLELAWSQKFANGFLLAANATFTDSDAEIENGNGDVRDISLPSQSDTTGNLTIGYENERWSLRLTGNYKSEYLYEIADVSDEQYDVHVDAQSQYDLSARVFLSKGLQLYVEARNLGDEPYYAYTGRRAYNYQYESYGPSYAIGISYSQF